ncbi:Flp1 family type IVb pilin [Paenibacillus dokdonensis]|uniref:Flp1 family type IVb pilin n=1 Tax=Paenibacillus dokdonensis TaxID=2567944 RepID=A0ABU6GL15_9BACL|nr:Flp1 family type IVb pilin [Paenibacillus dokdonensis]MEC0239410.1 Flp1 family type IVb pilin [Paenibacillus dokdonensis]
MLTWAWDKAKAFWKQEDGLGMLEMILIIAVIIIIALLFRKELLRIVERLLNKVDKKSDEVFSD